MEKALFGMWDEAEKAAGWAGGVGAGGKTSNRERGWTEGSMS